MLILEKKNIDLMINNGKTTTINVAKIVKGKLDKFKKKTGSRNYSDAINLLLEKIEYAELFQSTFKPNEILKVIQRGVEENAKILEEYKSNITSNKENIEKMLKKDKK